MRVLVIEDEPELRDVLARALREAGFAVDEAADGEEGLHMAVGGGYDALVLDLMLPRLDGFELLRRLRPSDDVPVLILSARDHVLDRVHGLDHGADDYLVKPFDLAELLARLRALIRRSAGRAHPVLMVGDVELDTAAKTVCRAGRPVHLTAREYTLVELLVLRRGEVMTQEQLVGHLRDENEPGLSNLVEVHVSNVRKKLGREFIVTRRGHGYLVESPSDGRAP